MFPGRRGRGGGGRERGRRESERVREREDKGEELHENKVTVLRKKKTLIYYQIIIL